MRVTTHWRTMNVTHYPTAGTAKQELIAVSTLISHDIYRTYKNPDATGTQMVKVTRISIVVFGLLMGVLAIILLEIRTTLGFVYLFMGIAIGGAVPPIYCCLTWTKASSTGAVAGAIIGTICGFIVWIVTAAILGGTVTYETLEGSNLDGLPMLFGNVASLAVSAIICVVLSLLHPQNYDWNTTRDIALVVEGTADSAITHSPEKHNTGEDSQEMLDSVAK
jgi:Na+/proline symporter